ncbi:hypothetical protein K6119_03085 [Paracrocinitomix mangrovi]|uniref:hypothetical protein n=1 Tax=Paracrocinitomix mangrovi TaxID=2862509 RepID=UPI001C8CF82F|nr:hypothetical protein [Paracrocinitomix mangrovi]UKN02504.1 hypothetical protein K6119_03085 [Paracrocinitomix mangrovi]
MKKLFLSVFVVLGASLGAVAQETPNKPERIKLYPSSHSTNNELTPQEEIIKCEQHLEALDQKEAAIKSNPEELKIAQENGWFENAEKTRKELKARIEELKKTK